VQYQDARDLARYGYSCYSHDAILVLVPDPASGVDLHWFASASEADAFILLRQADTGNPMSDYCILGEHEYAAELMKRLP